MGFSFFGIVSKGESMQPYLIRLLNETKTSLQEAVAHIDNLVENDVRYDEGDLTEITVLLKECQSKINRINERLPLVEPENEINVLGERLMKVNLDSIVEPKDFPRDETPYLGAGGDGLIKVVTSGEDSEKESKINLGAVIFWFIYLIGVTVFCATFYFLVFR